MIELQHLSFGYTKRETIISELSWVFESGSFTAITGPSGRGKSTLLYLVGLLLSPTSGMVVVNGENLSARRDPIRSRFRASNFGFVFQDAALDATRTVLDNVIEPSIYNGLPRNEALRNAALLMERFEVDLRADHRPGEVSGGQAQRIALCRALLCHPEVVLADEPTGNLDEETSGIVIDALRAQGHEENGTVIIATHDPAIIDACDLELQL